MSRLTARLSAALALACCLLSARPVRAYRPFDGTDADVAELGEFELELGPVQWLRQAGRFTLLAPATVLNLGIFPRTELVVDFVGNIPIPALPSEQRYQVRNTDVMLKVLLRPGVLQDAAGPSIALEAGALTPELYGRKGFGASANLIISERWQWFIAHLDNQAALSRDDLNFIWSTSLITEFRIDAKAWPVAELLWERTLGSGASVYSALAGGIWRVCQGVDLDAAVKVASVLGSSAFEARLGFTWAFQVWTPEP
jgi:hypothetical protein